MNSIIHFACLCVAGLVMAWCTSAFLLGLFGYLVYNRLGRYYFVGLALIWAEGTSHLIDRIAKQGLITDFLFIRTGPIHTGVFNVADAIVMPGLAVLSYECWKRREIGFPQPSAEVHN